ISVMVGSSINGCNTSYPLKALKIRLTSSCISADVILCSLACPKTASSIYSLSSSLLMECIRSRDSRNCLISSLTVSSLTMSELFSLLDQDFVSNDLLYFIVEHFFFHHIFTLSHQLP